MGKLQIDVYPDLESLSHAAAERFAQLAREAVDARGRFLIALSGGGTPISMFRLLTQPPYDTQVPWSQTHVFWGDERIVPPDNDESNYYNAKVNLLDHVAIREANIHRIRGDFAASASAEDYASKLLLFAEDNLPWPRFDYALMGLGSDGHTASLFPGPVAIAEPESSTLVTTANYEGRPSQRVTVTPMVFNNAHHVVFLVVGANKAEALAAVLAESGDHERWPARRIRPDPGSLTWMIDEAAGQVHFG